jgi:hypothetical protein
MYASRESYQMFTKLAKPPLGRVRIRNRLAVDLDDNSVTIHGSEYFSRHIDDVVSGRNGNAVVKCAVAPILSCSLQRSDKIFPELKINGIREVSEWSKPSVQPAFMIAGGTVSNGLSVL